jgi:Relaxase/Mobilisation nuclease domain
VVIKGTSCAGARRLAVHLTRTDTNERAEVKELRGVAAEDLRGALLEMEAVAAGARTSKPFYHGSINTRADERLTDAQRMQAIDRLEAALGLTDQARVVVVHQKEGREHCHIVWSRIDLGRMAAISDSHNYRKHEEVARALEREFGHERVQGAHIGRDGKERPDRTPSHAEMLQADRTGLSPQEVKAQITDLWRRTGTGQEFAVALWDAGFVLARGDRRDYVVIDQQGGTHSLARRVEGARASDIRERMADLDSARLPNVAEAKQIQRARQERGVERAQGATREAATETPRPAPQANTGLTHGTPEGPRAESYAAEGMSRGVGRALDGLANIFESLLAGKERNHERDKEPTPRPAPEPVPDRRAVQQAQSAQNAAHAKTQRRHDLLREFGREIVKDQEADIERKQERERQQDRGRERSR